MGANPCLTASSVPGFLDRFSTPSFRLQYVSKTSAERAGFGVPGRLLEEPDRGVECGRTEVHVALRHRQILVPGELLNRARRCAPHRQMRAERVPKDVHAAARACR